MYNRKKQENIDGVWYYTNTQNIQKKLLINPETNKPYKMGETITGDNRFAGKIFAEYRYDRTFPKDETYWGIKCIATTNLKEDYSGYKIPTPALVSFSGGRTSAFMLKQILNAYDGKLPDDIVVVFANTGKELPQTLDFVHQVGEMWDVDIHWIELQINEESPIWSFKKVDYETASRNGEPYDDLIIKKLMLPNLYQRICTIELKIKPIERFMRSLGYTDWYNALGLRYDEPKRVTDSKNAKNKYLNITPLYENKVTNQDVLKFWRASNFDLELPVVEGKTLGGNCDLCFLKGMNSLVPLLREKPELADWWIEKETILERRFRKDRPGYVKLVELAQDDTEYKYFDDDTYTCFCHD